MKLPKNLPFYRFETNWPKGDTIEAPEATGRVRVHFRDQQMGTVDPDRKMGTTGYCMGGPITMRTAWARADRIGAGASFHGGRLVTDEAQAERAWSRLLALFETALA